ncbi:MAG: hypothetical protein GWP09_00870, partial [Nitrospiraceae bacterium]|nr:hypothetical protein [Nitrospiraceae bacterium]
MDEQNTEIRINLETLYELLRIEKTKSEIQILPKSFYEDIIEYLETKKRDFPKTNVETLTSVANKDYYIRQLNNLRSIIKQLFEKREKKIIELALTNTRTKSNIINNILPQEKELYTTISGIISKFNKEILENIMNLKQPPEKISFIKQEADKNESAKKSISVRFTSSLPKFLATNNNNKIIT